MSSKIQTNLYFVAAALFATATTISIVNDGFEIKSFAGLLMVTAMGLMGLRSHKAQS